MEAESVCLGFRECLHGALDGVGGDGTAPNWDLNFSTSGSLRLPRPLSLPQHGKERLDVGE